MFLLFENIFYRANTERFMIGCLINQKKNEVVTDAIKETLIEVVVLKVQKLDRWKSLSQKCQFSSFV